MREPWDRGAILALLCLLVAGAAIRVALWPTRGHYLDIDQFVRWVNHIANNGIGRAYEEPISFPPVMVYIWAILATVEPVFRTAIDSSSVLIRAFMKAPASLADLAIAVCIVFWYRGRPRWALTAAAVVLLWPTTWYVSAWFGQYESLYSLPAVLVVLAARGNRPTLMAVLAAVMAMTKPQALPMLLPIAMWLWARYGSRVAITAAFIGLVTIVLLWLPFIGNGGPQAYAGWLEYYTNGVSGYASMNAWNAWWLVESASQGYLRDSLTVVGPISFRFLGFAAFITLALPLLAGIRRDPSAEKLALAMAATTLVAFVTLTGMHGRYAYAALPLLLLACNQRRVRWLTAAFAVTFGLNLLLITPAGITIPFLGQLGVIGPVVMTAIALLATLWTWQPPASDRDRDGGIATDAVWLPELH